MDARKLGNAPLGLGGREILEKWRSDKVSLVMADERFRRALDKLYARSELPTGSPAEREFFDALALLASLSVAKTAKKASFEQLWAQDSGKTWKALTQFPERLRNLAKEIDKMNGSRFFSPEQLVGNRVPSNCFQDLVRRFSEVPETLFHLANGVEVMAEELPALTSQHYWRQPGHLPWIDQLSELVNRFTGRFRDKEVAELLNAAEAALHDSKRGKNKGFDAQTLIAFRSRRKRNMART